MTWAQPSLADPTGSSSLVAAVSWLQDTLLGTIATTIAVVAVAIVGLMTLTGRIDWRRGAGVVAGCFILFGAGSIAAGIRTAAGGRAEVMYEPPPVAAYVPLFAPPPPTPRKPPTYDPYAGAAVPNG